MDRAAKTRAQAEEWRAIRRLVRRFGVETDQADDIAQDVALALHRTTSVLDRRALTWVIVKCKAASYYQQNRGRRRQAMERADATIEAQAHPAPSAEESMSVHGSIALLRRAIEELKSAAPELHAVLSLHMDGLTSTEIAAALGLPYGTTGGRLRRARARVCAQMERWTAENARRAQWAQLTKGAPKRWS